LPAAVVDASVLLAALEPDGADARQALVALAETHDLAAPTLLPFELGHVIHRKRPLGYGATPGERDEALDAALAAVALVAPDAGRLRAAARLVEAHRLGFYDACYLALAAADDASLLVTEDEALRGIAARVLGEGRALRAKDAAAWVG
jgi:predicted nucleic acid-binding protein